MPDGPNLQSGARTHKALPQKAVSVTGETGDRMKLFGMATGIPMSELVIMACRDEIVAGGKILEARKRR